MASVERAELGGTRMLILTSLREGTGNAITAARLAERIPAAYCSLLDINALPDAEALREHVCECQIGLVLGIHAYRAGRLLVGCGVPFAIVLGGTDMNVMLHDEPKRRVMLDAIAQACSARRAAHATHRPVALASPVRLQTPVATPGPDPSAHPCRRRPEPSSRSTASCWAGCSRRCPRRSPRPSSCRRRCAPAWRRSARPKRRSCGAPPARPRALAPWAHATCTCYVHMLHAVRTPPCAPCVLGMRVRCTCDAACGAGGGSSSRRTTCCCCCPRGCGRSRTSSSVRAP